MAGIVKWGRRGLLIVSEGLWSSLIASSYTPVAAVVWPHWLLKLNLKLCPILVWGTGDALGPRHVPSPPHHPLGAVSECNDNIVFPRKGAEAKRALRSAAQINTWLASWHAWFCLTWERETFFPMSTSIRGDLSLLLFGKINPRWTANSNQPSTV